MKKDGKTMNKTRRLAEIKRMVEQKGRIEVNALSEIFGVSEVTIRKDLDVLEEMSKKDIWSSTAGKRGNRAVVCPGGIPGNAY